MTPGKFTARMTGRAVKCAAFGLGFAVSVAVVMLPSLPSLSSLLPFAGARDVPARKPSAFGAASPAGDVTEAATAARMMQGVWQGQSTLPERGVCTLKLEVREKQLAGPLVGYSSLLCINIGPLMSRPQPGYGAAAMAALGRYNPVSSILGSPSWENGSMKFHVDKNIGVNRATGACALTSLTITPFGSGQVSGEWLDGCGGGELLLRKAGQ